MSETTDLLRDLCNAHGVSGCEDDVRTLIEARVRPLSDEIHTDALGSLIAIKRTTATNAPTLLLDAHMDEIGLIISYIEPTGFLRFATLGGWDERVLPAHAVDVRTQDGTRYRGVLGIPPPHIQTAEDKKRPYQVENLFIDVGARTAEEVRDMGIRAGDSAVPYYPFTEMPNEVVMGKALDNRAGCTVLIRTLENLFGTGGTGDGPQVNIAASFSTFEETGAFGAAAAAFRVQPDLALVLEGTVAGDCPGVSAARNPSRQGSGPAITLVDRSAHFPRPYVKFLQEIADSNGIPHQLKTPIFGGTNGARIQMSRAGVPTCVVSVPCRYIHSPHSTLRIRDLEHTISLTTAFARECHRYLVSSGL